MTGLLIGAAVIALYWTAFLSISFGDSVSRAYGSTWGEVMVDIRHRFLTGFPRLRRQSQRVAALLEDASYAGRASIRLRLVGKNLRRGRVDWLITETMGAGFAIVFGPLALAAENYAAYPLARLTIAWCDYVEARHIFGRSMRASASTVAATFPLLVTLRAAVQAARELWRQRREHARRRPNWAGARRIVGERQASQDAPPAEPRRVVSVDSDYSDPFKASTLLPRIGPYLN